MALTNIDIDDELVRLVMKQNGLPSKKAAVEFALRKVAIQPMTRDQMLSLQGIGFDGDLDEWRSGREFDLTSNSVNVES